MTRWASVAGGSSGDDYQRRFDEIAATGAAVHGEADFVSWLVGADARVLDAGCGTGRVAIELRRRGLEVIGVDCDASMLAVARRAAPELSWLERDLSVLDPGDPQLGECFDLVVLAGNVVPLLAVGTEERTVAALTGVLAERGRLVAGFGLDVDHLPLDDVPVTLAEYDAWCEGKGLTLEQRFATWERGSYGPGEGYAVSVHRRTA